MLELSSTSQTYIRKQSEAKKLKHTLQNFVWFLCHPAKVINELYPILFFLDHNSEKWCE